MHTIEVRKKLNVHERKMYVAAIAEAMDIKLPNKIILVTQDDMVTYRILGFNPVDIIAEKPGA